MTKLLPEPIVDAQELNLTAFVSSHGGAMRSADAPGTTATLSVSA